MRVCGGSDEEIESPDTRLASDRSHGSGQVTIAPRDGRIHR